MVGPSEAEAACEAANALGAGGSTSPAATQLQVQTHADVVHQVIQAARSGAFEGEPFEHVVLVGHPLGSAVALVVASRSADVEGLILTGLLPHAIPTGAPITTSSLYPSQAESRFRDRPPGYLTTRPGTRGLFYRAAASESEMLAVDEANKETLSLLEPTTVSDAAEREVSESVRVPVLSVVGEFDNVFCPRSCARPDSPAFAEAQHYPNVPCFRTEVVPGAGHVINLHLPAEHFFEVAREWLRALSRGQACARSAGPGSTHVRLHSLASRRHEQPVGRRSSQSVLGKRGPY